MSKALRFLNCVDSSNEFMRTMIPDMIKAIEQQKIFSIEDLIRILRGFQKYKAVSPSQVLKENLTQSVKSIIEIGIQRPSDALQILQHYEGVIECDPQTLRTLLRMCVECKKHLTDAEQSALEDICARPAIARMLKDPIFVLSLRENGVSSPAAARAPRGNGSAGAAETVVSNQTRETRVSSAAAARAPRGNESARSTSRTAARAVRSAGDVNTVVSNQEIRDFFNHSRLMATELYDTSFQVQTRRQAVLQNTPRLQELVEPAGQPVSGHNPSTVNNIIINLDGLAKIAEKMQENKSGGSKWSRRHYVILTTACAMAAGFIWQKNPSISFEPRKSGEGAASGANANPSSNSNPRENTRASEDRKQNNTNEGNDGQEQNEQKNSRKQNNTNEGNDGQEQNEQNDDPKQNNTNEDEESFDPDYIIETIKNMYEYIQWTADAAYGYAHMNPVRVSTVMATFGTWLSYFIARGIHTILPDPGTAQGMVNAAFRSVPLPGARMFNGGRR